MFLCLCVFSDIFTTQLVFVNEKIDNDVIDLLGLSKGMYIAVLTDQATGNRVMQKVTFID